MLLTLAREKHLYHRCQSSLESFAKTPLLISRTQRLKISKCLWCRIKVLIFGFGKVKIQTAFESFLQISEQKYLKFRFANLIAQNETFFQFFIHCATQWQISLLYSIRRTSWCTSLYQKSGKKLSTQIVTLYLLNLKMKIQDTRDISMDACWLKKTFCL